LYICTVRSNAFLQRGSCLKGTVAGYELQRRAWQAVCTHQNQTGCPNLCLAALIQLPFCFRFGCCRLVDEDAFKESDRLKT
jgi:hypothetical protein